MTFTIRACFGVLALMATFVAGPATAKTDDPDRLETFLEVTGFDVALESIRLSAESAPAMLGIETEDFGSEWTRLADEVFDTELMHDEAIDILSEALTDDLLDHAVDFYTSDLGRRLVAVENASHMDDDDELRQEAGQAIVAGLVQIGSPRLEELKRLNGATGSEDASVHAIQEVQVRFLMAAAAAGVIELRMEEEDLRESLKTQEGELRRGMQIAGLAGSAYTYQAFSDDEITAYADALENPTMQRVYELMNAVQFQIMSDRYEALAARLQGLQPSQEL